MSASLQVEVFSRPREESICVDTYSLLPRHPAETRIPVLDGLRGLAVLMVMFMHFTALQSPQSPLGKALHELLGVGWIGVDLFFVLSGFLITGILIGARQSTHYFRNFYARRVLRIFPLYYGYLIVLFLAAIPLLSHKTSWSDSANLRECVDKQAYFWLYGTNLLLVQEGRFLTGFLDHFWSLAIEEHFYLLWPAAVFICSPRRLWLVCVVTIALAAVARIGCSWGGGWALSTYVLTPCRMDSLAIGALACLVFRNVTFTSGIVRCLRLAFVCTGVLTTAYFVVRGHVEWVAPAFVVCGYPVIAVCFASLLLLSVCKASGTLTGRLFGSKILGFFGKYSYGLYVYHLPIWVIKNRILSPDYILRHVPSLSLALLLDVCVPFVASVTISVVSWHVFEKQCLKLKRFFEYRSH